MKDLESLLCRQRLTWKLLVVPFMGLKGLAGGFGVSADNAWEAFAGVSYVFVGWCSATLGYRYLRENYSRSSFAFDLDAHGFLLGFGFRF